MFVPEENLLGAEHQGFYLIMANFQWERLLMALGAVGAMQVCFEQTLAHLRGAVLRAGDASRAGRGRDDHSGRTLTSPTPRCAGTSPARTRCAR